MINKHESEPKISKYPAAWDLYFEHIAKSVRDDQFDHDVLKIFFADIKERDQIGLEKYGVRLQPHNGRRPLVDAYQEFMDAIVYTTQAWYEETNTTTKEKLRMIAIDLSEQACFYRKLIQMKYGE